MEDELHKTGAVAHVDEDQAAVVAAAVHPAGDARRGVGAGGRELGGPGVAKAVWLRRALHHRRCPRRIAAITAPVASSFCSLLLMSLRLVCSPSFTMAT